MAKKFGGFTPEQMGKIIPEMAGMQADEQAKFLAATPSAAARVGKLAEAAQKQVKMAEGGYVSGYSKGGDAQRQRDTFNAANAAITAQQEAFDSSRMQAENCLHP